jgi:hypothetical protein
MLLKCKKISDPYFGPHSDVEIITYYLYDSQNVEYRWHSGPNKELNCKLGDILDGIVIKEILNENLTSKKIINYKKSFPNIVNLQDIMNL